MIVAVENLVRLREAVAAQRQKRGVGPILDGGGCRKVRQAAHGRSQSRSGFAAGARRFLQPTFPTLAVSSVAFSSTKVMFAPLGPCMSSSSGTSILASAARLRR